MTFVSTSNITITGGEIKAGSLIATKEEYHQPECSGAGIGGGYGGTRQCHQHLH